MTTESKATVSNDNEKPLSGPEMLERATEGFNLFQDGHFSESLAIFEKLSAMDPSEAYFQTALGACHLALEDLDTAVACFNRAIELDPTDITPFVNRGEAFLRQGRTMEAARDFQHAVSLDPEDKDPLSRRARMLAAAALESSDEASEAEAPEDRS
ncbi:tetratricopeptide repeat protein [Corallococcus exercitus]|uniref:Tetratricopeptide repeat protein n=1 Tax=Corallococcus exercitus TaxID=2316736 RepID=A0A3A8H187_9BACT|nr:tetratricopeptide repeat protein [Corallococcus exercitus]NOK39565.1 tetratricopeptide repeat protein [Corallococcus exercitus]RKG64615.1 tetratricopeptide repeat protein [Corallococcus exercitus]